MAPVLWIRQRDSFDTESSDETPPIPNPSNVSETGSKRKTDSPAPTSIPKPTSTAFGSVEEGGWLDFLNFGSDEQKSRSRGASAEKSETFTSFASPTSTHDNARLPDPTHSEEGLGSNIIKAVEGVFDGGKDADTESRGFFPTPSGRSQQLSVTSTTSSVKPTETRPPSEVVGEKIDEVKIAAAACDGGFSLSSPECVQSFNEHPARTVVSNAGYALFFVATFLLVCLFLIWICKVFRKKTKSIGKSTSSPQSGTTKTVETTTV